MGQAMGDHERDLARPLEEIGSLRAENKRLRELLGWVQADRDFDTARELGEASINVALR